MKLLEVFIPIPSRGSKEELTLSKLSKGSSSPFCSFMDVHAAFHDRFERLLRDEIDHKLGTIRPFTGSVAVEIVMSFHFPKSVKRFEKDGSPSDHYREFQVASPDIDKAARCILDALTGIVYLDDKQVSELEAAKVYVHEIEPEGVSIHVRTLEQNRDDLQTQQTIKHDTAFNLYKAREEAKKDTAKQRRANRKKREKEQEETQ